jgi:hypothetical protein
MAPNLCTSNFSCRRMFPVLKLRFSGIRPSALYLIYMDLSPVQREHRFRYACPFPSIPYYVFIGILHISDNKSQWQSGGKADKPKFGRLFLHTDSPFTGEQASQPFYANLFFWFYFVFSLKNNPLPNSLENIFPFISWPNPATSSASKRSN